ncbi:MAG: APC family permease [Omnitrophica WOR_2 bacterium]
MLNRLKYLLIGSPLPTQQMGEKRLNKIRALAAFSPDALSSIAYANQEIYLGLVVAGSAGLVLSFPIGLAIVVVLLVVSLSYFQTIHGYPSGGGSYIVARENLGTHLGLLAAAALLIDYVLTAAVSLTAGVEAIASAFPVLWSYRVPASLIMLVLITLINLRGLHETGTAMAVPVYLFLFTYIPMLLYGFVRLKTEGTVPLALVAPPAVQSLSLIMILHAFSAGCTALTGIESISNGVPAFREPASKNAGRTLMVMAILMAFLFLGSIGLTQYLGVVAHSEETILAALSRRLLGSGIAYVVVQTTTMLILTVAANTSFAGFPRVAAILAKDGFLPRQFTNLGDRLVFANGILALAIASGFLIVIFLGDSHLLVPLFAVGAFLAFTLSQAGMVFHWIREHGRGWVLKAFANGLGAIATGITLFVIAISKFIDGAWITVILIPLLVLMFTRIRSHYREVGSRLTLRGLPSPLPLLSPAHVIIPISGVHLGIIDAMEFAQSISKDITAVYVELEPGTGAQIRETWEHWWPDVPLVVIPSPYRSIVSPLLEYLDRNDREYGNGDPAIVILPEYIPNNWWQGLLHNQTTRLLEEALLYHRSQKGSQHRVIVEFPYRLNK